MITKHQYIHNKSGDNQTLNLYVFVCLGILFVIIISSINYYLVYRKSAPLVFDLQFGFGELIQSLFKNKSYSSTDGFWTGHRMPIIPYLLLVISFINTSTLFALIIKNLLVFSISGFSFYIVIRQMGKFGNLLFYSIFIYICFFPHLILYSTSLDVEEGYLVHFLALLFAGLFFFDELHLNRHRFFLVALALLNALLFLTKSSMLLPAIILCIAFFLRSNRNLLVLVLFISLCIAGVLFWGISNYVHSGKFTISSSTNGWNFYKGNNPDALRLYPYYCLDILDSSEFMKSIRNNNPNEWDIDKAYFNHAVTFITSHPKDAINLFGRKAFVFFLEIRKIPIEYSEGETQKSTERYLFSLVSTFGMLIFRILLFSAIFLAFKSLLQNSCIAGQMLNQKAVNAISYLVFIIGYSIPYLFGFAYTRHIVPLIIPTIYYLLWLYRYMRIQ